MNLSKMLIKTMKTLNFTQTDLAKQVNQSRANLSKKIIANNFRFNEFEKLMNAMGCSVEIKITMPTGE